MVEPSITVIIPARDAERTIRKCLDSVVSVNYGNYKVIIINDNSADRTPDILKEYAQKVKIITNSSSIGPSESRNIAAKMTDSEYIAFTDADCIVDTSWLTELTKALLIISGSIACGGSQDIPEDATRFERDIFNLFKKTGSVTDYMHKTCSDSVIEVEHNASCNVIYKRNIFVEVGGFTKGLWPGEDVDLDYRIKRKGCKIYYNPKAKVYHYRHKDLRSFLDMMHRYGKAQGFLVRKYGFFRRIHILPFAALSISVYLFAMLFFDLAQLLMAIVCASLILLLALGFNRNVFILTITGFLWWNAGFFYELLKGGKG